MMRTPMFLSALLSSAALVSTAAAATQLPQWNGSFTDRTEKHVTFTMVGGDPANTAATHVGVVLVPVIAVYDKGNGTRVFNPLKHKEDENRQTVIQNLANSPLFTSNIDYIQGGTDLGTTQFLDAFQRGNFWKSVKQNPNYHLLYDATVADQPLEIHVASGQGSVIRNPYGSGRVGTFDFTDFDSLAREYISAEQATINPSVVPLFVTWNVFLAEAGECCIGGYRSLTGAAPDAQTYAFASYIDAKTTYAEDISAIAVELGQITDDPFLVNQVNCRNTPELDIAAPLQGNGFFPLMENNYTYHLPSFAFVTYFGAPQSTSVNKWHSFQGDQLHPCEGQRH